ncbi:hypothetical protein ACIHFC_35955 [Streptomyces sp. NPDC052013]|uniref:hypothetical protein n=1 Tax=Streptomyces sp. NPDC052013 TaxID=3365679 RepID=UPI0037D26B5A
MRGLVRAAKAVDDQLIDELVGRAQAEGLQLTKRLLESALEGEPFRLFCRLVVR